MSAFAHTWFWLLLLWLARMVPAQAESHPLPAPGNDWIGRVASAKTGPKDTLLDIAYRHGLGYKEVIWANPRLDPWLPGENAAVTLPNAYLIPEGPRTGIIVNLPEMRLYYFPPVGRDEAAEVQTYPIGIGKLDWSLPLFQTTISQKFLDPIWLVPDSIKREYAERDEFIPDEILPGSNNPLGRHALKLGQSPYLIHGTNRKYGIGMRVSHGCIRLYPGDVANLYASVAENTPVRIIDKPYKAGWKDGTLYLEVHPPLQESATSYTLTTMVAEVIRATRDVPARIDWNRALTVAAEARGIPLSIGHAAPDDR